MARTFERQTTELHIRAALLNRFTRLGTPTTQRVAQPTRESAEPQPQADPRSRAVLSRGVIDLSMMVAAWGPIPEAVWNKARRAYGDTVDLAYGKAVARIRDPGWLQRCMGAMSMAPDLAGPLLALHGGPLPRADEPDERHEAGQALQPRPSTTRFSPKSLSCPRP